MQDRQQHETALLGALADLRVTMAKYLPASPDRIGAESMFRRIEEGLLEGLALRSTIVGQIGEGVFIAEPMDGDFRWVFVNSAFCAIAGMASDSLIGKPMCAAPEIAIRDRCCEAVASRESVRFYSTFERSDAKVDVQIRLTPLLDEDGNCFKVVGVARDVTEQKTGERLLRKQNRRLQNILGSISDGFIVVNREGRITFVNNRAEEILCASREDLIGAALCDEIPELGAEMPRDIVEVEWVRNCQPSDQSATPDKARWISARAFPSQEGMAIYLQDISSRKHAEHELRQGLQQMRASLDGIVNAMAYTVEMRDPFTAGHQRRVSALACAIARELGFTSAQIETMRIAGLLHDIGKISVPSEILNRPGNLSEAERSIIRTHAQTGYEILKEIEFSAPVALIALQHHERLDGSGYPQGLHSEDIIPEARILAIADVVEAMASHRPYRPALGVETALKEVMLHRGVRYDDTAVDACLSVFTESGFDFEQLMNTEMDRRNSEVLE
jgi:putative nucleotidyltransferase with HDIG domain/PAS domain S-box-containing protein